jgi:hypothetical protein
MNVFLKLIGRTVVSVRGGVASDKPSDAENCCADVVELTFDDGTTLMISAYDSTNECQFPEFVEYTPHVETVWLEPLEEVVR